jgi:exosortase/archaeosortase family protein
LPVMHFGIRGLWKKATFLACVALVTFVKNGIRIVTLALLAIHVDPSFLFGRLHRQGGIVFFLIGLLLLLPIYLALQDKPSSMRKDQQKADDLQPGAASPSPNPSA